MGFFLCLFMCVRVLSLFCYLVFVGKSIVALAERIGATKRKKRIKIGKLGVLIEEEEAEKSRIIKASLSFFLGKITSNNKKN